MLGVGGEGLIDGLLIVARELPITPSWISSSDDTAGSPIRALPTPVPPFVKTGPSTVGLARAGA